MELLKSADLAADSWLFWGEASTGKTGIAIGYGWDFLQAGGEHVTFRAVPRLLSELRATYDRESRRNQPSRYDTDEGYTPDQEETEASILQRLKTTGLLILDDIGSERATEWAIERLYDVVDTRNGTGRPAIFTSNLPIRTLQDHLGKRISERIIEMCARGRNIIHVEGRNLRRD